MFAENVIRLHRRELRPSRKVFISARDAWDMVRRAIRAYTSRRYLAEMDDRTLADLGISRAQAQFEASRRIWDITPSETSRR